ncbi:MarR family transcriptional regulator [Ralstonia sp. A12]|uniref:MarR family winged helix-turn-helix transcriptional regulator n=1 Tax=Ralstonia sp. A12 TaxID=1217052 RepID=UPI000573F5BD|nr:MarR family winged helix-turn-helix transcriptional regulator [Ralstonia sp. A12]KHK52902.1 MarR family transcriptional regulator [Ralstonia sp. A12]
MTAPDRRLVYLISVGQRRLQRWIQARTGEGVTAAQSGLLFFLEKNDGALMREAGAALDLGPSAMSGLVDRSADAGLIERRADAKDGRAWQLWITPAGREALAETRTGLTELNARLTEGFSDAEIDVVARWLASLQTKFPTGDE